MGQILCVTHAYDLLYAVISLWTRADWMCGEAVCMTLSRHKADFIHPTGNHNYIENSNCV